MVDYYDEWMITDINEQNGADSILVVQCPECEQTVVFDLYSKGTKSSQGDQYSNNADVECEECGKFLNCYSCVTVTDTKQKDD